MFQYVLAGSALWAVHVTLSDGQTCPFSMSLEVPLCPLPPGVERDGGWWAVCHLWSFLVFFPFLFLYNRKCIFVLFFSISIFMFFIVYFHLWPLRKKFYVFNLVLKLQFVIYFFFYLLLILLIFYFFSLALSLKFYWSSISSFNQSFFFFNLALILLIFFFCYSFFLFNLTLQLKFFLCPLIYLFYFDFHHLSFNYIFFVWLRFFLISSFDI